MKKYSVLYVFICLFFMLIENFVLSSSQNNHLMKNEESQIWCQAGQNRDMQIRQWVASQIVYNRIRVLEEQLKSDKGSKNKNEKNDKKYCILLNRFTK